MIGYLDTIDSDSDYIPEGDTDDTSEEEQKDVLHATPPAAHPVSDSEEDGMDGEDYREVCHLSNVSLFLSNPENSLDLSICLLMILLQLLTFHLFFTDLILTLMVTESNGCMQ
jgi:hypothetical protein